MTTKNKINLSVKSKKKPGRHKVDIKDKKKARPVSLDDAEYSKYVKHSYKHGKTWTNMVRHLFDKSIEEDIINKQHEIINLNNND